MSFSDGFEIKFTETMSSKNHFEDSNNLNIN